MNETVDLFEQYETLPQEVQDILLDFGDEQSYEGCEKLLAELKPHGYTFEYYLDASPFNLTKINMKQIDLRDNLKRKKYATTKETTLHINSKYVGFRSPSIGVGFIKQTKDGIRTDKTGQVRWFHSIETSLVEAIKFVREVYKIKLPRKGWSTIRVKHYNTSTVEQIVEALNQYN